MRFRLFLLCLPVWLAACSKSSAPVRLDFVGATGLTSGSRLVGSADTLLTRAYAVSADNALQRLEISVAYEPGLQPISYPSPISGYDPKKNAPGTLQVVYLDSLIRPINRTDPQGNLTSEYLFQNQFVARVSSGTELWTYTTTDARSQSASRGLRLTVRKADSAAVYQAYTTRLQAIARTANVRDSVRAIARSFLNLHYGLLLPKYSITTHKPNQQLVDLIAVTNGQTFSLSAPTNADVVGTGLGWPLTNRRATELRSTALTPAAFTAATTEANFTAIFATGAEFTLNKSSTGTLGINQVIAFKTLEDTTSRYGLLQVVGFRFLPTPTIICAVRMQK